MKSPATAQPALMREILGDGDGAKLLQKTLGEEAATDEKLTKLAKSSVNLAAAN
jgi:ferritin-like metal-binding protein YciE